jgi:hypothetical protein
MDNRSLLGLLPVSLLLGSALAQSPPVPESPLPLLELEGGSLTWGTTGEWELGNDSFDGNPFDLVASVTFEHTESGESVTTEMFHAGDDRWRFRFAATRLGEWSFETSSDDPELDGHEGVVEVIEGGPDAQGFLQAEGQKLFVPTDDGSSRRGVLYNAYVVYIEDLPDVSGLLPDDGRLEERIDEVLDEVEQNGFPVLFLQVFNNWFSFGARAYGDHDSENPDLTTFAVLDTLLTRAHQRGMFVHLWAWGDERRRFTASGVGGINGVPDRRLQRYIAARMGPLPGWSMAYGFDLEEWVSGDEVRSWARYIEKHSGWPHLFTAREFGEDDDGTFFTLGSDKLGIFSTDDRPERDFFELAVERLEEADLPLLLERRFVYRRDDVWDQDTSRRALWQFTMAGGAGAIWGPFFRDATPYPNPEQFRIHRQFWFDRFLLELERTESSGDAYTLATPDGEQLVIYQEDAREVQLDLSAMAGPLSAVAVDTRGEEYREIDLGQMAAGVQLWEAPHRSDWAIAVGFSD